MTLGGIAVAMGELVDDAIVDVENIFRRLKENNTLPIDHEAVDSVVYEASKEIRSAIVFGTAVVILVVPAAVRAVGRRRSIVHAARVRLHRFDSGVVRRVADGHAGPFVLPAAAVESDASRGRWVACCMDLKWIASHLIRLSMAMPRTLLDGDLAGRCPRRLADVSTWAETSCRHSMKAAFRSTSHCHLVRHWMHRIKVSGIIDSVFQSMQKTDENPDGEILHFVRRTGRAEMDEHASPVNVGEYILSMNPGIATRDREEILARTAGRRSATKRRALISKSSSRWPT